MSLRSLIWIVMLTPVLMLSGESRGGPGGVGVMPPRGPEVTISTVRGLTLTPVPPGMGDTDTLVVPKKGQDYDFDTLRQALVKLRATYPKLPPLFVKPTLGVPWWVVVHTVETARRTATGKPLFPVVFLGVSGDREGDQ